MSENLKKALDYLFHNEGETYTDNPADSGGPTKYGVTQKEYSRFLGRLVTAEEMKNLTKEEAGVFYEEVFWTPIQGNKIESVAKAIAIFDVSVLYGKVRAVKMTQDSLVFLGAKLSVDGLMGEITLDDLNHCDTDRFLTCFSGLVLRRINEVCSLASKNEVFRSGWTIRAKKLLTLVNHEVQTC